MKESRNEKDKPSLYHKLLAYVALAILLSLSALAWRHYKNMSVEKEQRRFGEYVDATAQDIGKRLEMHNMLLHAGAGVFAASETVTREKWRAYYESILANNAYPGIHAICFSEVIRPSELEGHIQKIRADGFPEYTVRPEGKRDLYTPIMYMEPMDERRRGALGYDMFSDPVRRAAMERARDTGAASISTKVRLVREEDQDFQAGFLLYVPLYARGSPLNSVEDRRVALKGYVYGVFRMGDFMRGAFPEPNQKIDMQIYDGAETSPGALMFDSHVSPDAPGAKRRPMFATRTTLDLYGHQWTLAFRSMPAFEDAVDRYTPKYILAAGLLISLLIFLFLKLQETTGDRALSLAREMTSAVRESEKKYRLVVDNMADVITVMDLNLRFTYVSSSIIRLRGYTVEEAMAQSLEQVMTPESLQIVSRILEEEMKLEASGTADPGRSRTVELQEYRKDGSTVWIENSLSYMRDQTRKPVGIISVSRDITDRKRAEAERERLTTAIEQVREMIVITDSEGMIQYVNPAFESVTGYRRQEAVGQNPRMLKSGKQDHQFYQNLWNTIASRKTWEGRMVNRRKDGKLFTEDASISPVLDTSGRVVNYVAVKRDITEKLGLEEQFNQAQKMESVGRLAGGVAHDFNNKLTVMLGYTQMAMESLGKGDPKYGDLQEVLNAGQQSVAIVRQLLAFARKQIISPRVLNLNETMEDMLKMLRRFIGEDIDLAWSPGHDLWQVKMDPSQLDQILANLCVNARDAIEGVGKVTIETENRVLDRSYCDYHPGCLPGEYVMLAVTDSGCGMDKETLANAFEPFFTTKEVGKGTGLGLSTVYGIVKQNQGFVNIYSEPGNGTSFKIYLPRNIGGTDEGIEVVQTEAPRGRGESILVVEDEASVLGVARRILEKLGYAVLTSASPAEAVNLAREYQGEIHLLMTDVVLPGMNGRDLAGEISKIRPAIRTLFMSGYTADVVVQQGVLDKDVEFIEKPFSPDSLARKVRKAMGKRN